MEIKLTGVSLVGNHVSEGRNTPVGGRQRAGMHRFAVAPAVASIAGTRLS